MAQVLLADEKDKINPLLEPVLDSAAGRHETTDELSRGHFLCLDGFGPVSNEERAAGMPFHGESYILPGSSDPSEKRQRRTALNSL